ncbi:MAG TPA: alpha/beta fold hydrolase [Actinomycetota bacterium]|nr:alpha/beta fold hydrolase [Actinomycetota bacterium]
MTVLRSVVASALTIALALGLPVGAAAGPKHSAEDATVKNPDDGTEIAITIFKPAAAAQGQVPVVLHSHGWSGSRETEIGGAVESMLDAGFAVVSIDQRGHGESGGQANVQDPELETEDVQAVIDHIATLDWIRLDGPGDPVMGAIGGSYGGGYQTMTALDEIHETGMTRFNALAPEITWHDLPQSLAPQKVVRTAWNVLLYAAGSSMVPNYIHEAFAWGTATNQWPDGTLYGQPVPGAPNLDKIFTRHSPIWYAQHGIRIDVPVLIRQGLTDNLFPLNEAVHNFEDVLTPQARSQSYLLAHNGGHALPNALPPGNTPEAQLGGGTDACSPKGNFTKLTIEFFERVFSGKSTAGLMPARYNLTTASGDKCLHLDALPSGKAVGVDPTGYGPTIATAGLGAPMHLPLADGPMTLAGIPRLSGKVTSAGLDARAFFGLAVGATPGDATVIDNNLMPLRRIMPGQDQKFSIELAGVSIEIPDGQSLFLTITPVSDMFFGHGSRTPGGLVLSGLQVAVPQVGR